MTMVVVFVRPAQRVFWVVDNGSSHRGRASIERMSKAWPTARLVHLPVHASWLDRRDLLLHRGMNGTTRYFRR